VQLVVVVVLSKLMMISKIFPFVYRTSRKAVVELPSREHSGSGSER
jgi:hypothetical protein